jgi:iron complex transport system ATP-binding protein
MKQVPKISLVNAALGYKKAKANIKILQELNLNFFASDFMGVTGLNGTGKSTLLKSICGLLPLLDGDIALDGSSITELPMTEIAKKVAIVLTERIGGFNMTVYDAVATGQIPYTNAFHTITEEHQLIIESAMQTCGIKEYALKALTELSDGLFQKTMIARALAQQTPVILLDEPTAFLDYASKHELFILLRKLSQEGRCILVSSHDLDLVLKYCTTILVVSNTSAEQVSVSSALQNESFLKIAGGYI